MKRKDHRQTKQEVHGAWLVVKKIPLIALVAAALLTSAVAVLALRSNNLKMLQLREALVEADKSGEEVEAALKALQSQVTQHMNTSLASGTLVSEKPIQLTGAYSRAVLAARASESARREQVAAEAQSVCEGLFPRPPLTNRAKCVQDYIAARPVAEQAVDKDFYTYDFASPIWSPDLAGWSIVLAICLIVILILRLVAWVAVRQYLKVDNI